MDPPNHMLAMIDVLFPQRKAQIHCRILKDIFRMKRQREGSLERLDAEREELLECPVFRVMSGATTCGNSFSVGQRSDIVEVIKCKFGPNEVSRALHYFKTHFLTPLRKLRFQAWLSRDQQLNDTCLVTEFTQVVLAKHRHSLRQCDLSRNRLSCADVNLLLGEKGLDIGNNELLEVLDVSYNPIGDEGAVQILRMIRNNPFIRAVIMKHCGVTDDGALLLSNLVRERKSPRNNAHQEEASIFGLQREVKKMFFINLNENRIGASGTVAISRNLPDFVSLTLCQQQPKHNRSA